MSRTKLTKTIKYATVATDIVLVAVDNKQLKILLIEMKRKPYTGLWAIPGGMVNPDESVDQAAERHLANKTGLKNIYMEQLYTFGEVKRDPFGRVVSVAYLALLPDISKLSIKTNSEYTAIAWHNINHLPKLGYDHKAIAKLAIERLRSKLAYTNIVYGLLPNEFTQADLQKVYEIILGRGLDKRNFRKKILSLGLIKPTGKNTLGEAHRPAKLYKFVSREPRAIEIL
jgi:8-oxo-dGTP diphosphatase